MAETLIFQLTAAVGAMGEFGGHERRTGLTWPGRSALIGLIGAALGIRRDGDFSRLDALEIAVAVFEPGDVLRDYHTAETIPSAKAKSPQSRPEALRTAGRLNTNTTITIRDYRTGPLYGVALRGDDLPTIRAALTQPTFALWLGRKSCALSAPLDPQIVEAESWEDALSNLRLPIWHEGARAARLYTDAAPHGTQVDERHDRPVDRQLWHFAPRRVAVHAVDIAPDVALEDTR